LMILKSVFFGGVMRTLGLKKTRIDRVLASSGSGVSFKAQFNADS
jgi:hypothetical protein